LPKGGIPLFEKACPEFIEGGVGEICQSILRFFIAYEEALNNSDL
jgi:hypothetical protein